MAFTGNALAFSLVVVEATEALELLGFRKDKGLTVCHAASQSVPYTHFEACWR